MKKELYIFLILFIVLAIGMHPDFLVSPVKRVIELPKAGAYGLGSFHPIVFVLLGYIFLWFVRVIYKTTMKLF